MSPQKPLTLSRPEVPDDEGSLVDTEWNEVTLPSELAKGEAFDTELPADAFHLTRVRPKVTGQVNGVDAGELSALVHNAFFVPGKVPSLNDLLEARGAVAPVLRSIIMRRKPSNPKSRGARFDLYNDIKQDWKQRTIAALGASFVRVNAAFFHYLVVEETLRRDPSNIFSAAVKFIEDGLVSAGAIPNDGWGTVLGIRTHCIHREGQKPGVYVMMTDRRIEEEQLVIEYEAAYLRSA